MHSAEKILLPQPLPFGGDYPRSRQGCAIASSPMEAVRDHYDGFAEIRLRLLWRVGERHGHLSTAQRPLPDRRPCPRTGGGLRPPALRIVSPPVTPRAIGLGPVAAAWLDVAQTIRCPLGGTVLLAVPIRVPVEPRIDDRGKPIRLRPIDRRPAPKARGRRERQYLVHTVARDVEVACRRALVPAVGAGQTNLPAKFHGVSKPAMLSQEKQSGRLSRRPPQAYRAATLTDFCTAVLIVTSGVL